LPFIVTVWVNGFTKDAVLANEAVVAKLELTALEEDIANEAVPANCEVFEPVYELNEDVVTNDPVSILPPDPEIVNSDPVPSYIRVPSV